MAAPNPGRAGAGCSASPHTPGPTAGCFPYGSCLSPQQRPVLPSHFSHLPWALCRFRGEAAARNQLTLRGLFFFWKGIANVLFASRNLIRKLRQLHFNRGPDSAPIQTRSEFAPNLPFHQSPRKYSPSNDQIGYWCGAGSWKTGCWGKPSSSRAPSPKRSPTAASGVPSTGPPSGSPNRFGTAPGSLPPR